MRDLETAELNREHRYECFARFREDFPTHCEARREQAAALSRREIRVFLAPDVDDWQVSLRANLRKIAFRKTKASIFDREWQTESVVERGGELLYEMTDTGMVWCCFYGYKTQYSSPTEGMLLFQRDCNPVILATSGIPQRHWSAFQAYLRVTCLDDVATPWDHLYVRWLRWSKPLMNKEREVMNPRFSLFGLKASTWLPVTIAAGVISTLSKLVVDWMLK